MSALSSGTVPHLLSELQHADSIIAAMLGAMTIQQKSKVHAQLEAAGISGEGMTRHHERRAAINASRLAAPVEGVAQAVTLGAAALRQRMLDIETYAVDIGAQAQSIEILLQAVFEKLDDLGDAGPMASALAAINCFATCALRNAALIHEAEDNIIALVAVGETA